MIDATSGLKKTFGFHVLYILQLQCNDSILLELQEESKYVIN